MKEWNAFILMAVQLASEKIRTAIYDFLPPDFRVFLTNLILWEGRQK